ncbi:MAG TPA: UDP-2,3-diacylglucosamine diphosphatase LpxI [Stellaceae bacterium]|nr:UDP-2,3-diacylglucosamine diphosphatase LpxI [Stellaceae bacterium]
MAARLGVVAGGGELPLRVIETARALARPVFVLALEGIADATVVGEAPHAWVRLGAAGEGFRLLREAGVEDVVLVGAVSRPSLAALRPDWRAAKFLARVSLRALGDDGLLRAVIAEFEGEGFRVVSLETLIADALAPEGAIGARMPGAEDEADIARGIEAAQELGRLDIGQAVVVQQGMVLGVEGIDGTDALILRCGALRRPGAGPVLVKIAKPGQDRRADLPTIGARTVELAADAGFAGIAVEAGSTLLVDRAAIAAAADARGLFVVGIRVP